LAVYNPIGTPLKSWELFSNGQSIVLALQPPVSSDFGKQK
jgi:hypothetical protein